MAETRMELKRERRDGNEIVMTFRKNVIGDIVDETIVVTVDSGNDFFEIIVPGNLANDAFNHPFAYRETNYCTYWHTDVQVAVA